MVYSLDLRIRVINYVENGGSVVKAAKLFRVGRASIYRWLNRETLEATKVKHRNRKLDWSASENSEARLIDRAKKFGVRPSAISYDLKQMKITRKKNSFVIEKGTDKKEYNTIELSENVIKIYGGESLVFIDESGFEGFVTKIMPGQREVKKYMVSDKGNEE